MDHAARSRGGGASPPGAASLAAGMAEGWSEERAASVIKPPARRRRHVSTTRESDARAPLRSLYTPSARGACALALAPRAAAQSRRRTRVVHEGSARRIVARAHRFAMATSCEPPAAPAHLVVLLHGVAGQGNHLEVMAETLRARFGAAALVVTPECYRRTGTYDGVDVCGERVLTELRGIVAAHPSLRALSLVGYSFGGLVARYLAGALAVERPLAFLGLTPLNYASFACPHLGPTLLHLPGHAPGAPPRAATSPAISLFFLRRLGGLSGAQLALADPTQLLLLLAHPRSVFYKALAAFQHRAVYANASGDRTVPHWTAFIAPWRHGAPLPPPPPAVVESEYPHVEWDGVVGGGVAAPESAAEASASDEAAAAAATADATPHFSRDTGGSTPLTGVLLGPPARFATDAEAAISSRNMAKLLALVPVGLILLPLWFAIVPSLLVSMGLYKRHTLNGPPLRPELLALDREGASEASTWPQALRLEMKEVLAEPQAWMATSLNRLAWHKVSVRFSIERDGITAIHTHGHVIVRRRRVNEAGMDVLRHLADTMLHTS